MESQEAGGVENVENVEGDVNVGGAEQAPEDPAVSDGGTATDADQPAGDGAPVTPVNDPGEQVDPAPAAPEPQQPEQSASTPADQAARDS